MNARIPALLGALALGAVALTGCSAAAGGAGAAADLAGARQPVLKATAAETTAGQVTATSLTQDDFRSEARNCLPSGQVKVCQLLQTSGVGSAASVSWTTWVAVPQTTSYDVKLEIGGGGTYAFDYVANVQAQSQYVELDWQSPGIPSLTDFQTDVTLGLEDGSYLADCFPSFMGHGDYDMEECTPPTLNVE